MQIHPVIEMMENAKDENGIITACIKGLEMQRKGDISGQELREKWAIYWRKRLFPVISAKIEAFYKGDLFKSQRVVWAEWLKGIKSTTEKDRFPYIENGKHRFRREDIDRWHEMEGWYFLCGEKPAVEIQKFVAFRLYADFTYWKKSNDLDAWAKGNNANEWEWSPTP